MLCVGYDVVPLCNRGLFVVEVFSLRGGIIKSYDVLGVTFAEEFGKALLLIWEGFAYHMVSKP